MNSKTKIEVNPNEVKDTKEAIRKLKKDKSVIKKESEMFADKVKPKG